MKKPSLVVEEKEKDKVTAKAYDHLEKEKDEGSIPLVRTESQWNVTR